MNIEEKFARGAESHTYLRIDSEFKVNVFLGYNEDGHMSIVIAEPGKETVVKSSKLIDVSLKRREDQKLALKFDLLDDAYKSMFMIFCKDIIVVCERASILDKQEIKGLIGELIELKDHFIRDYGENVAVQSWMGPLLGHKDFEVDDTWYEVKAVAENAVQVNISSLEQLESEVDGHLVIIRLEDASVTSALAVNLNQMVLKVANEIHDPETLDLFRTRLDNMGYAPDEEYDNFNFVFKGRQSYSVTEKFPRLTRSGVSESIGNAKYTILLNGISDFKE